MKENNIQRNSSIELLRIISMIMIVFHHFAFYGGFEWDSSGASVPFFWYNFILMGGKIGVNVFVLISGYFLINSKVNIVNINRILKFWGQVFFYSIVIYLIFSKGKFSIGALIIRFFPISYSLWWFASTYFVLYLLHPFLNKLLHCLDKRKYQYLLLILVVCWSVIPTFLTSFYQSNDLLWFITLYAIAGYIRLYGLNDKFKLKHYWFSCFIFLAITYALGVIGTLLGLKSGTIVYDSMYFFGQQKISVLLISVSLFMAFATMKMNYHKSLNVIASATFGVYLIHDSDIIRPLLWNDMFKNATYQNTLMIIPYSIAVVTLVYVVCTVIDLIRQNVFEKLFMMLVNKYSGLLMKPLEKVADISKRVIFGQDKENE